jgi:hypothetical protein
MRNFYLTIDVLASAARVWEVMFDIDRWHEWTPSISRIKRADHRPLAVGSRVVIRQPKFPPAQWIVTDLKPGVSFTWVSIAPGLRIFGHHSVEITATGSRVTLRIEIHGILGGLWGWMTRKIIERYIGFEAAGLKARSENAQFMAERIPDQH